VDQHQRRAAAGALVGDLEPVDLDPLHPPVLLATGPTRLPSHERASPRRDRPRIVVWRGRHVAEPTELSDEEAVGYWREVLRVASAVERHFRTVKLNYQLLGNAVPHLHTHLVPRYADDPSPGRPLDFPDAERPQIPADRLRRDAQALRALV
jgi:diadenosine tetraphosphate (Ap4A) HIT family hydrolase